MSFIVKAKFFKEIPHYLNELNQTWHQLTAVQNHLVFMTVHTRNFGIFIYDKISKGMLVTSFLFFFSENNKKNEI